MLFPSSHVTTWHTVRTKTFVQQISDPATHARIEKLDEYNDRLFSKSVRPILKVGSYLTVHALLGLSARRFFPSFGLQHTIAKAITWPSLPANSRLTGK